MCGIAGLAWADSNQPSPPGLLQKMVARIAHRGPDGDGFYEQPGVSLGHRRLAIIDLDGGKQPIANEDHSIWVTFNGEIYNFQSLHADLEKRGHQFRTKSDTETLVHLYEEMGPRMLEKLRGMFAFAIWDDRQKLLFLARDRIGKKPLVYRHDANGLRFASELKCLTIEPGFPKDVDLVAIDQYLMYQYIPHPRTIFQAVRKLPPGHFAIYQHGKLTVERYWHPPYETEVSMNEADAIAELRATLTEATRLRMIADVPLGAFLSGGIDSTIVVGLMQELAQGPVKTFSIGFPVAAYDESNHAARAAKHLGTDHHQLMVEPEALRIVEKLAWFYDEPFADSSAVPTYYLSELTRKHVTVSLSGDGGDELFAGYPRYQAVRMGEEFDRLPAPIRGVLANQIWQKIPVPARQKSRRRRAQKLLRVIGEAPTNRYQHWISIFDAKARDEIYSPDMREKLDGHHASDILRQLYQEMPGRDFLTRTTYVDLNSYLPCDILTKVDIASMAHGLECRCPFLDHEVIGFAGRLPVKLKMRGRSMKYLLKKAFADFFPPKLIDRPKMGFGVPIDSWLRQEMAPLTRDLLFSQTLAARGWFSSSAVERLFNEHLSKKWDHSFRLWALLMLELWARNYLDK